METIEAFDARADGQRRKVTLARDRVVIERAVKGVEMRVGLEPRQYMGVLLDELRAEETDVLWRVSLRHVDPDLAITLEMLDCEADARGAQRLWARYFRLPCGVERADGSFEIAPSGGPPSPRRRGRATLRRRNRFLMRRKVGAPISSELFDGRSVQSET